MYYEFFGLNQPPFRITPNTEFFFGGGNRGPILEALLYAVTHGEGIVKVTGEVGSGKTMLCNMMMARLTENVETVYIAHPGVSPDEILHAIAFDLQLPVANQAGRLEVMQALHDYLLARHAESKRVVVFVEESQGMPLATLEEIRLLSNLETRNDKLLQIVLFGQPELDEHLREPNIRQLRDRITHSFRLTPLTEPEIREYLMFRVRAAGYRGPDLFPGNVIRRIAQASAGLTRRVNLLADKTLLAAFSENTHTLKPAHVDAAIRDSEFSQDAARGLGRTRRWGWAAAVAAGAALGAGGYAWYARHTANEHVVASAAPAVSPASKSVATAELRPPPPAKFAPPASTAIETAPETAAETRPAAVLAHSDDILQSRIDATTLWLRQQRDAAWTLQTLSTTSEDDLRSYLAKLKKTIEFNNIFVYRYYRDGDEKPVLSVLYGAYENQGAAERQLAELPPHLKSNRPWPRTIESVRAEMR